SLLVAQPATLSQQATLQSLSFDVTTAAGNLVLGIYKDNGSGYPGALVAQTAEFVPVKGWNTKPTTTTPTLTPGTYWLTYWPSSGSLNFLKQDGGVPTAYYPPVTFGATMPATYPAGAPGVSTIWGIYATLLGGPPPPPPPPTLAAPTGLTAQWASSTSVSLGW